MIVVSLFDGLGGARIALDELGIPVTKYYASEIDSFAMQVSSHNYPDIIQLGNVKDINPEVFKEQIDLLIGGSPCQNLSSAGDKTGLQGEKSSLFFEFLRLMKELKPRNFILENVASMSGEHKEEISKYMGTQPIKINSEYFSAQKRNRLYWTSFPVELPDTKNATVLKDILEDKVEECFNLSPVMITHFQNHKKGKWKVNDVNNKSKVVIASAAKRTSNCNYVPWETAPSNVRMLTPREFERLQGIPEGYTDVVSKTQRYRMIGNGFNIPTIKHLLVCMLNNK